MQDAGRPRWCPGWDSNPHTPEGIGGFKPPASTDSATRARPNDSPRNEILTGQKTIGLCLARGAARHVRARRWRAAGVLRPQALRRVSTMPSSTGDNSPESSTASHNAARARSALAPASPLAATTPSIMSATTADHGRPFRWTATVGTPPRNRSVRCTPSNPGGDRNPGTTRERKRAACPRERAAAANRRLVASTDRHSASGV